MTRLRFGTLEEQARWRQDDPREKRVLSGIYGDHLITRGELGALMGGDRSFSSLNEQWATLPVYTAQEIK